jgi:hypothetical protein
LKLKLKHLVCTSAWNVIINLGGLQKMLPALELLLAE